LCKFTQMTDVKQEELPLVLVTGALGFVGSCVAMDLHRTGRYRVAVCDDLTADRKTPNLGGTEFVYVIERKVLIALLEAGELSDLTAIIHIGARTDTTEFNKAIFDELNVEYSKALWAIATDRQIPFIYASSAATYGAGELGYKDDHAIINQLKPLNPYGDSKNEFDQWVLTQQSAPSQWYGLKFFNVYGPNEYHKSRMASVIFHAFNQFKENGKVKLFRSHRNDFEDGKQLRDFVYVKDVIQVIHFLLQQQPQNGIYNLGTGTARAFYDLAKATAEAMQIPLQIDWIDIPEDIRDKYQYFTEADMQKLQQAGYKNTFHTLEEGITDYVQQYLLPNKHF
jgi:ADP-L-glycero-D-manno-heptose 6-epimerase